MTSVERDDLDPEVLADPVEDDKPATQLVQAKGRSLVPADPFRRYLAEIRRYPPLDRDEERELARRYRDTGDREALFRLITANLRLVVRVAYSFQRAAHNLLDLVQEGNIGLLRAIERFDPELGVRLPTYAGWWVRAFMVKFLLDNVRLVRVGTTNARRKLLRNLRKEKQRLEELGYDVGPKLLAEHFGVSEDDVTDVQMALDSRDVFLDEPVGEEGSPSRIDSMADERAEQVDDSVARGELQARAKEAIDEFRENLTEREVTILDGRILSEEPMTLQQLGDINEFEARDRKAKRSRLSAYDSPGGP
jgi:RNA polymerase sigma-32 factor